MYDKITKILDAAPSPATKSETFNIPGVSGHHGSYTYRTEYQPNSASSPTIDFTGTNSADGAFTLVPYIPTAPGEVYLNRVTGDLLFYPDDADIEVTIQYAIRKSLVQACDINQLITWSHIRPAYIHGVPQAETVGANHPSPPAATILVPGGYAPYITVKSVVIKCNDWSAMPAAGGDTTLIISSLANYTTGEGGAGGNWEDDGVEDVFGITATLSGATWDNAHRVQAWWYVRKDVDWRIDLSAGEDVLLNIFRDPSSTGGHANITVELLGI